MPSSIQTCWKAQGWEHRSLSKSDVDDKQYCHLWLLLGSIIIIPTYVIVRVVSCSPKQRSLLRCGVIFFKSYKCSVSLFHACIGLACFVDNPHSAVETSWRHLGSSDWYLWHRGKRWKTVQTCHLRNLCDERSWRIFSFLKCPIWIAEMFRFYRVFSRQLFSLRKQAAERKQALQDQFSERKHWEWALCEFEKKRM